MSTLLRTIQQTGHGQRSREMMPVQASQILIALRLLVVKLEMNRFQLDEIMYFSIAIRILEPFPPE